MIPSACLRVFRPLETFSPRERAHWQRYIEEGGRPPAARAVYRDEPADQERRVGMLSLAEGDHAEIRVEDGVHYVCPLHTRLRVLTAMLSLRDTAPSELVEVFVPETEARRAARELARLRRREPHATPTVLESPWHVPVRWFVLVDDPERRLVEGPGGTYRLAYWTPIGLARSRAQRALEKLHRSDFAAVSPMIGELLQWLAQFHPHSRLELDYGSVAGLFSWDELDDDHSGREIQLAVDALGRPGGMARAGELYETVAGRWAEAMSRQTLN
jgi:hypothetical protein